MNYQIHYNRLIERARNRQLSGYVEKHHVVPRCLGGTDEKINIVKLTAEEHFLAHLLLVNIYPGNHKLIGAAILMATSTRKNTNRANNKLYGWLRRDFSKSQTGRKFSMETRKRLSGSHTGKPQSEAQILANKARRGFHANEKQRAALNLGRHPSMYAKRGEQISKAKKGKPQSEEHKKALSIVRTGKKHTEEHKDNISKALVGITRSTETKNKMSIARRKTLERKKLILT